MDGPATPSIKIREERRGAKSAKRKKKKKKTLEICFEGRREGKGREGETETFRRLSFSWKNEEHDKRRRAAKKTN